MSIIRLTKEFSFEMAHVLEGYDGLCSQIHGHSYRLFVTVKGTPLADLSDPKLGMVMDFGLLKEIINRLIVSKYDHALMMRETASSAALINTLRTSFERIIAVPFQPTCENLIAVFAAAIIPELPLGVTLHSLRLHETVTSFAEWFAEDNGAFRHTGSN